MLASSVKEGFDGYNCNVVVPSAESMSYGKVFNNPVNAVNYNGYMSVNDGYAAGQAACGQYSMRSCGSGNLNMARVVSARNTQAYEHNRPKSSYASISPSRVQPNIAPVEIPRMLSGDDDPLHSGGDETRTLSSPDSIESIIDSAQIMPPDSSRISQGARMLAEGDIPSQPFPELM
jgi:hypothetical protein